MMKMRKTKVKFLIKISIVFAIYAGVFLWLAMHITTEPESTFRKYVYEYEETLDDVTEADDIKVYVDGSYKTVDGYCLYEVNGWQAEKNDGLWRSTAVGIVLKNGEGKQYCVDVKNKKLPYAARLIGAELNSDKIAYQAYIPTCYLDAGLYQVGIMMKENRVIWSDLTFTTHIFNEIYESGSALIENQNLIYDIESDELLGIGSWICIKLSNEEEKEILGVSFNGKAFSPNTYLVFVANDITERVDLSENDYLYGLSFPLKKGENELWIYCVVDGETELETRKYFSMKNFQLEFKSDRRNTDDL